jgi:hypothetical protein
MSTAVSPPVITHFSAWVACTNVDRRCRDAPAVAKLEVDQTASQIHLEADI